MGILVGPLVGASSAGTLDSFSGKGNGYALGVSVDLSALPASVKAPISAAYTQIRNALPSQIKDAIPAQFNFVVDEKLIETLAQMGVSQKAQSALGSGTADLGKLLGGTSGAESTAIGTSHVVTKALNLPTADMPLVDVAAGVLDTAVASGPKVSSVGTLSQVAASLQSLKALFPPDLNDAFDQLTTSVQGAIDTANTSLSSQLSNVATTLSNTTDPVVGGLLDKAGLGSVANSVPQLTTALTNALEAAEDQRHPQRQRRSDP